MKLKTEPINLIPGVFKREMMAQELMLPTAMTLLRLWWLKIILQITNKYNCPAT